MELMSFDEIHEIHEKYRVKHTFMKLQEHFTLPTAVTASGVVYSNVTATVLLASGLSSTPTDTLKSILAMISGSCSYRPQTPTPLGE
jgi:hypothetical protein